MPRIEIQTTLRATPERCFDCARDLDLHLESMASSAERIVAGKRSGLIGMGEEVTWRARHFGLVHEHASRITAFERPLHFRDEMIRGRFRRFVHDHYFDPDPVGTRMRDVLEFQSPLGALGGLVDRLILVRYLERLLEGRNEVVRAAAESQTGAESE